MDWILLSLIAALISAVAWVSGDIALVGFTPDEKRHADYLRDAHINKKEFAIYMLDGSMPRLRFGALIADFTVPLMLAGLYFLFMFAAPSPWRLLVILLLFIGFATSAPAHIAFYYFGSLSHLLYDNYRTNSRHNRQGEALFNEYVRVTNITWGFAMGFTALGWIGYTILIFSGQTAFPPLFGLMTPLFMSPLACLLTMQGHLGSPYLNGAGMNLGATVFYLAALIFYLV